MSASPLTLPSMTVPGSIDIGTLQVVTSAVSVPQSPPLLGGWSACTS